MSLELDAREFLSLPRSLRIVTCREMATEARRLAGQSSELRSAYLELADKWCALANEMTQLGGD